jgi:hypothetical protein
MKEYLKKLGVKEYDIIRYGMPTDTELKSFALDNAQFDCGQGYYTDESKFYFMVGEQCYSAYVRGEVMSRKMDVGKRVYWIESPYTVSIEKCDTPEPPIYHNINLKFNLTVDEYNQLLDYCKLNGLNVLNEIAIVY